MLSESVGYILSPNLIALSLSIFRGGAT